MFLIWSLILPKEFYAAGTSNALTTSKASPCSNCSFSMAFHVLAKVPLYLVFAFLIAPFRVFPMASLLRLLAWVFKTLKRLEVCCFKFSYFLFNFLCACLLFSNHHKPLRILHLHFLGPPR